MAAIVSSDGELTDLGTGEPLILPPLDERIAVPGGEVFWSPKRDSVDDLDYRHIHYQQRLTYSGALSNLLPEPYSDEGVPFSGGSLKLHFDAEGVLYFVSGAYFNNPQTPTDLSIQTPFAAVSRAWWALENTAGFEMADLSALGAGTLEELLEFTKLKLVSSGDGRTFSLIWEAPALLANGTSLMVVLNGETEDLIHFWDPNPHQITPGGTAPCLVQSSNGTSATARPQNFPLIDERTGLAATPSDATPGFTHEAFWPKTSGAEVHIYGYRGTGGDACTSYPGIQKYEVAPLPTVDQAPHYGNADDQKIVGDAVWKTKLTMEVFDELGWDGYDDQGSPARIVVEAQGGCPAGNAMFVHDNPTAEYGPNNSVVICPKDPTEQTFSSAASLDVVAHEWGHGVVFEAAGWPYNNLLRQQLHEGWADVIAHGIEWRKEGPTSSAPETEDWEFDEDSLRTNPRKANLDDGVFVNNPDPVPDENPYSYHALDLGGGDYGHYGGMRLAVAYWLAADGGTDDGQHEHKNPVCRRDPDPTWADCNLQVSPLGDWPATRIFFRGLTVYADATDDWNDFAEYAKQSAYDLYKVDPPGSSCSNAYDEQDTVQDAFTAIGYPGSTPSHRYCQLCGCPN